MHILLIILSALLAISAQAWDVECGDQALRYADGKVLVSRGGTVYYSNGRTLIGLEGSVYFSKGLSFRGQGDTLYYENGLQLKSYSGEYFYDNGVMAKSQWGTLYRRDGSVTENPFFINVNLGEGVTAKVNVQKGMDPASDMQISVRRGNGENLIIDLNPYGILCRGVQELPEITVNGRAGVARVVIKPGNDPERVRRYIQRALDTR